MLLSATRCDNLFLYGVSFNKSYLGNQKEELKRSLVRDASFLIPPKFVLDKYSLKSLLGVTPNGFSTFDELLSGFISEDFVQLEKKKKSWGIP